MHRPRVSGAADWLALLFLTAGGAGLLRPGPGTWGSAVGILLHFGATRALGGEEWLAFPLAAAFFMGTVALGGAAVRIFGTKDPGSVVSDEVAGVLVAIAFTGGAAAPGLGFWPRAALAFALFRLFDISKPWPCKRLEQLPGGLGIAADDIMAGVYANLALRIGLSIHARFG